jgi:hypothetical protein
MVMLIILFLKGAQNKRFRAKNENTCQNSAIFLEKTLIY